MGRNASSGAGRSVDGIEGSDEARLAYVDITRTESRYVDVLEHMALVFPP